MTKKNILLVTTPLVNAYINSLMDNNENWSIIEIQGKKVFHDRKKIERSFIYKSNLQMILELRKAKRYIESLINIYGANNTKLYFTHALHPITNWLVHHQQCEINIIPDGMLNFIPTNNIFKQTPLQKIKTQISSYLICGKKYIPPLGDIYSSAHTLYNTCYYLTNKSLVPPRCQNLKALTLERRTTVEHSTLFLGQYTRKNNSKIYDSHVKKIILKEISGGVKLKYRPHPNENISADLYNFLTLNGIKIYKGKETLELEETVFSRYVSVSSSSLLTMKMVDPCSTCVAYPINFFEIEKNAYLGSVKALREHGVEIHE